MCDVGSLHAQILRTIIRSGRAPTIDELAREANISRKAMISALHELQQAHGVVLHPKNDEIWVIHPFSLAPTLFTVRSGQDLWWGNCAWCSLGVAALLNRDCQIISTLGGHGDRVVVSVQDGQISPSDLYVHFPIPMEEAWDNVIYTCSTMLFFRREEDVNAWSVRHGIPKGDVQPLPLIWSFARKWYGRHLDDDWKKWTVTEAKEIFHEFGLTGSVWKLPDVEGRF